MNEIKTKIGLILVMSMLVICIMPTVVVVMTAGGTYSHNSPFADFTYTPWLGLTTENITFNASDSYDPDGTIFSYSWDFDASNGIQEDAAGIEVTHQYATAGTYTVTLTVTSTTGTDTVTKDVVVKAEPIASFSYSSVSATEIRFTDTSTDPDGGTIIGRYWEFGDGLTSLEQNPAHMFEQGEADYTVTLAAMDNDYLVNTTSVTVHAGTGPVNIPPTADFTWTLNPPHEVRFNDTSTDSDGKIIGWLWDFGDGFASMLKNPTHHYATTGTYTVTLIVTDDDGAGDIIHVNITMGTTNNAADTPATPSAAPFATPTATPTTHIPAASPSTQPAPKPPGFEAVFTAAGLLAVAYLVLSAKKKGVIK